MLSVSTQIGKGDNIATFGRMLASVAFADELVIFAIELTGNAEFEKLAKKYKAKVIDTPRPLIVEHIREDQVIKASHEWVLIMDFDEVVTQDLAEEIRKAISSRRDIGAYAIPRVNYSLGAQLTHGGWGRDTVVRLVQKSAFESWPRDIHSSPVVRGDIGLLTFAMEHHKDESIEYIVDKTNRYSESEAKQFFDGGLPLVTPRTLARKKFMETIRRGILWGGILDGPVGVIQSIYQGFSVFISYAKLYELQEKKKGV